MNNLIDPIANGLGEWAVTINIYSILLRIVLSVVLGAIIGCERSSKRHAAGLRTFILVSLASTVAMLLDISIENNTCILTAASIIGIATISVNSILYSSRNQIKGLTTAVGLWACGLIGAAAGAGYYSITLVTFVAFVCSLSVFPKFEIYLKNRSNHFEVHIEMKNPSYLKDFVTVIRKLGLKIDDIEANPAYANSGLSVYSISISIRSHELKQYKTHSEIIEALSTLDYIYHIEEIN